MSCDVDATMRVTAVDSGPQIQAPPPLKCWPRRTDADFTGYWDVSQGREVGTSAFANAAGRTDTEGCCWWGRGALLTRGVCQIGKINYFLGKRGADLGRATLYPTIDFCKFPEAVCTSAKWPLPWTTALFEWSERVQRYQKDNWTFEDELIKFVDDGMSDVDGSDSFFDAVCRILSRGCHESGCSEAEVRRMTQRKANFFMILYDVFDLASLLDHVVQVKPVFKPDPQPSTLLTAGGREQPATSSEDVMLAPPAPAGLPVAFPSQQISDLPPTSNQTSSPVAQPERNMSSNGEFGAIENDVLSGNTIGIQQNSTSTANQAFSSKGLTIASIIYTFIIF